VKSDGEIYPESGIYLIDHNYWIQLFNMHSTIGDR
jgi:hypothetical protein